MMVCLMSHLFVSVPDIHHDVVTVHPPDEGPDDFTVCPLDDDPDDRFLFGLVEDDVYCIVDGVMMMIRCQTKASF